VENFCAKIKAGKDAQLAPDFVLVARTEAFITGHGLEEALKRAEAYREAGADAIIVHSRQTHPGEVMAFLSEWGNRLPVILIPTMYYSTPVREFERAGASMVIWANHLLRAGLQAMQETATQIQKDEGVLSVEDQIAPISEVFRIQGDEELQEAELKYGKPVGEEQPWAVILAATRGSALEDLTETVPKTLLPVAGLSLFERHCRNLRALGIEDIHVVAGYRKDTLQRPGVTRHDNDDWAQTGEAVSLRCAEDALNGPGLIVFGDILCRRYLLQILLADEGDFVMAVDRQTLNRPDGRPRDLVRFQPGPATLPFLEVVYELQGIEFSSEPDDFDGEWTGLLKVSGRGATVMRELMADLSTGPEWRRQNIGDLLNRLVSRGETVRVHTVPSHWTAVETAIDLIRANTENR
jgi:phosphoenolpyruvate phosphomutase